MTADRYPPPLFPFLCRNPRTVGMSAAYFPFLPESSFTVGKPFMHIAFRQNSASNQSMPGKTYIFR